jgi:hypothetical protein
MKHKFNVSPVVPSIRTLGSKEGNAPHAARLNLVSTLGPRRVLHSINCKSPERADSVEEIGDRTKLIEWWCRTGAVKSPN